MRDVSRAAADAVNRSLGRHRHVLDGWEGSLQATKKRSISDFPKGLIMAKWRRNGAFCMRIALGPIAVQSGLRTPGVRVRRSGRCRA
jgi:hypothetical protein